MRDRAGEFHKLSNARVRQNVYWATNRLRDDMLAGLAPFRPQQDFMAHHIERQLRDHVETFVAEISEIVREATLASVYAALGSTQDGAARGPRRKSAGRKRAARKSASPKTAARKSAARKKSGRHRSSDEIAALGKDFLDYVRATPGQRLEEISAGIGVPTSELKRPVMLLGEAGKIRTEGQKRGTRYYTARPGGAGKKKAARTKAARTKAGRRKKATRKTRTGRKSGKKATRAGRMSAGTMASEAAVR